jgi:hypothetical protein
MTANEKLKRFTDLWERNLEPIRDRLKDLADRSGLTDARRTDCELGACAQARKAYSKADTPPDDAAFLDFVAFFVGEAVGRAVLIATPKPGESKLVALGLSLQEQAGFHGQGSAFFVATEKVVERYRLGMLPPMTDAATQHYIDRIAVNYENDKWRKARSGPGTVSLDASPDDGAAFDPADADADTGSEILVRTEEWQAILREVENLNDTERAIVQAKIAYPDASHKELCDLLPFETTEHVVRQRLYEVRKKLDARLYPPDDAAVQP